MVDTNLLVDRLIVPFLGRLPTTTTADAERADRFFLGLVRSNGTGLVPPTVFNEFVHVAIKFRYRQELLDRGENPNQWAWLYKRDPSLLRSFGPALDHRRRLIIANGLLLVTPEFFFGPVDSERRFDEELVHLAHTYGLDSHDALIPMETRRMGMTDLVTLDTDMLRARNDFNLYTWL